MQQLKLGIIGCGNMTRSHVGALAKIDLVEVVAVADVVEESAREVAKLAGAASVHADYRELLALREVQAVLISSPHFLHKEMTVAALEAGKDVLCEKPMAITVAECDEMLATAERTGRKLMVGQVLRLMPPFVQVRRMIASGDLGKPLAAVINRVQGNPLRPRPVPADYWRRSRAKTGGMLHETSVHEFDLLRSVFGEPARVYARSASLLHPDSEFDDYNTVLIDFKAGGIATLHGSYIGPIPNVGGTFTCEKGVVTYTWGREPSIRHQRYEDEKPTDTAVGEGFQTGLVAEDTMFARWVLEGEEPEITGWDGRQAIAMVEAAYESAGSDRAVKVK